MPEFVEELTLAEQIDSPSGRLFSFRKSVELTAIIGGFRHLKTLWWELQSQTIRLSARIVIHKGAYDSQKRYSPGMPNRKFEIVELTRSLPVGRAVPDVVPPVVVDAGSRAAFCFLEFFTAHIRNPNTRIAYLHNARRFFEWARERRLALASIQSIHVAAYVEQLRMSGFSDPTVKQHLAAVRMLFDWLVVGQVVPFNPAAPVRGPKHVVKKGKTPVLMEQEARELLESIDVSHVVGLRDRALIGVMVYTFARVHAVLSLRIQDYFPQGKRWWLRLTEKNSKVIDMPAHHSSRQARS